VNAQTAFSIEVSFMKVTVNRSGGYAGISDSFSVDTDKIAGAAGQQIEQMIRSIGFFSFPAGAAGVGADLMHYEITVDDGQSQHTIAFSDDGSPQIEPLKRLVEKLSEAA
jgi:hypothetical protein